MAASAEEYFSIGMAYFNLGKFDEAERWLNRARQADRTMVASTYNLGRLAYELKRYEEAASRFEDILKRDPYNILALEAAAFSRIRTGDMETADRHYSALLNLIPESADSGYNHALVLYAMARYSEAEAALKRYPYSLLENNEAMLLYARSQKAQRKIEAIDSYASLLKITPDPKARYEYAQTLEYHTIYARAAEEYRKAHSDTPAANKDPDRSEIRFALSRVLLTADSSGNEGITELQSAVHEGFDNVDLIEELLSINNISAENSASIRNIINSVLRPAEPEQEQDAAS